MMKSCLIVACVAGLTTSALAQRAVEPMNALAAPVALTGGLDANLIENFETFTVGGFPSGGWTSNFDPNFSITDTNTIGGVRSWLHTSDDSGFADTGFSPTFSEAHGIVAADIRITGASVYQFNTASTSGGSYNTRINFNTNGTIDALQVVGGVGQFFPTTGTFTPGTTFQIAIETLPGGALNVYKDGVNIFTGTEINFALSGVGNGIGQALQFAGNTAGGGGTMMIDNVTNTIVPAPASLALLGLGGLVGSRRRR